MASYEIECICNSTHTHFEQLSSSLVGVCDVYSVDRSEKTMVKNLRVVDGRLPNRTPEMFHGTYYHKIEDWWVSLCWIRIQK